MHVGRTAKWIEAARQPITRDDVEQLIRSDPELSWSTSDYVGMRDVAKTPRYYSIKWRGSPSFYWYRDQIISASPNEVQMRKLIRISVRLGALVLGDDNERYILTCTLLGQERVKAIRP